MSSKFKKKKKKQEEDEEALKLFYSNLICILY